MRCMTATQNGYEKSVGRQRDLPTPYLSTLCSQPAYQTSGYPNGIAGGR